MSCKKENILYNVLFWFLWVKVNLDINGDVDEKLIRKKYIYLLIISYKNCKIINLFDREYIVLNYNVIFFFKILKLVIFFFICSM